MEARSRNEIARRMAILMTARMEPELMTCRDVVGTGRYPYTGKLGISKVFRVYEIPGRSHYTGNGIYKYYNAGNSKI